MATRQTENSKQTGETKADARLEEAQAARENEQTREEKDDRTQHVLDAENAVAQPEDPIQPETYVDSNGIARLAGGTPPSGWEPAPIDPDPELVKRGEERERKAAEARKQQAEQIRKTADESLKSDKAPVEDTKESH